MKEETKEALGGVAKAMGAESITFCEESAGAEPVVKVFRVNDYEWWAGTDLESIGVAYKEATGIDPNDDEGFDNPQEVSAAGMDKLIHWGEGEPGEDDKCTFRGRVAADDRGWPGVPLLFRGHGVLIDLRRIT